MGDIFASLCSCLCFVLFEDARVVYLPNSVCVIFQCYVSDEVLSSYYWNDNSSFPESKGREEGGERGTTSPHDPLLCSSSILTLILSAHGCWSPPWCFPDARARREHWQKKHPTALPTVALSQSNADTHRHTHTDLVSSTAHCSVQETPSTAQKTFGIQLNLLGKLGKGSRRATIDGSVVEL